MCLIILWQNVQLHFVTQRRPGNFPSYAENIFDADSFYEQPRVSLILMLSVTVSAKQLDDLSFDHCGSTFFV